MDQDDKSKPPDADATLAASSPSGYVAQEALQKSQHIGNYRLIRRVGEGGMGEVWEAEQERPLRRQVALKLIRAGMGTEQFIARFEAERQALALMDHPSIAKIFDGGATEDGRPYFAMEFVSGVPIVEYCDARKMETSQRLRLFIQVCEGVQHAHQKAIIHRDLKPSNILVSTQDDKPAPKIIDFGVAKATDEKLTERTMHTRAGALVGTLEYMSPEQVEVSGLDIDTRTDVYALGVILYELLVGKLPFDTRDLARTGLDEICRIIREDDPERPSTRISTLGDSSATSAQIRRTDRRGLSRLLRGELDWITMKALEKDRSRRYDSPRALADDIGRYLSQEPVEAGPPSRTYRMRKFVRRHRTAVVGGVFVVMALVLGTIGSTYGLLRATRAETEARHETAKAKAVNEILQNMLASVSPEQAKGDEVTVREVLDEASKQVGEATAPDEIEVEAAVQNTIGVTYQALGLYEEAERHLASALETRRELAGADHADVAESLHNLGRLLWSRADYAAAEGLIEEALAMNRRLFGGRHESVVNCLVDLAVVFQSQGEFERAEPMLREALTLRRELSGDDDPKLADNLSNLAWCLQFKGEVAEAEALFREALEQSRRQLGAEHPNIPQFMMNLGTVLQLQGKFEESEAMYLESLQTMRVVLGSEHPLMLQGLLALGELYLNLGRADDAEPLLREAREAAEQTLGPDHTLTMRLLAGLGWVHRARGDLAAAEPYYRETLARRERALGQQHPNTLRSRWQLSRLLVDQHKYAEAERIAREVLPLAREVFPPGNENLSCTLVYLGLAMVGQGRHAGAESLLREALRAREQSLPAGSWQIEQARNGLGAAVAGQGRFEEAETLIVVSYEQLEKAQSVPSIRVDRALGRAISLYESWYAAEPTGARADELAHWKEVGASRL